MLDPYNRQIDYLRVSITDKCNLRCVYCMPQGGIPLIPHEEVLRFEEILDTVKAAVELGIRKVRITGGEPLVRRGIVNLIQMLSGVEGIDDFAMTTNGILLKPFAQSLASAGLHRVNVSLDAINPERFLQITRGGDVLQVIEGIHAAREAGIHPIKLNCVIQASPDEPDAVEVAHFAEKEGLEVRFIRRMNLAEGHFSTVIGGTGGDCARCNRLRLSSNGIVRPCLFNNLGFNIRDEGPHMALRKAIEAKPQSGQTSNGHLHAIGG